MALRYRYRLYPNRPQREALARAFGSARVVCNDGVAARREAHRAGTKYPSSTVLQRQRRERQNACGADVGPPLAAAVGGEAGTHRSVPA